MPVEAPEPGGGEEYTGQWEHISAYPDVELSGVAGGEDVQAVVTRALPSNVVFTLRFLPEAYVPGIVSSLRSQFAGYFNAAVAIPGVAGVTTYQDVTASDQLQDVMEFVVTSTSGRSTFPLVVTPFGRQLALVAEDVAATRANLDAIETGR